MLRSSGRSSTKEVRALHIAVNLLGHCHSSACVELGNTRIVCAVKHPQQLVHEYRGTRGRISCLVHRSPSGTTASTTGMTDSDSASIDRDMALALEGVAEQLVILERMSQLLAEVVIEIVADDGGLWDAASTAMAVALAAGGFELYDMFSSCSAAVLKDGSLVIDASNEEESKASAIVVVCTALTSGGIAFMLHRGSCEPATLNELLQLACNGVQIRRDRILSQTVLSGRSSRSNTLDWSIKGISMEKIHYVIESRGEAVHGKKTFEGLEDAASIFMLGEMNAKVIQQQCKKHQGYSTPELNEKLYLNHLGFTRIASLEGYTNCAVLYLTNNAISDLAPLAVLPNLHTLYISSNALTSCVSLPLLPSLRQLDVSHNAVSGLEGIAEGAPNLETLLASHNCISRLEGCRLHTLRQLTTLDVAYNQLQRGEAVLDEVRNLAPSLRTCIFTGNAFLRHLPHYRKSIIHLLPELRYLDQHPVFPEERETAEAFATGGAVAEAAARAAIREREAKRRAEQAAYFEAAVDAPRATRRTHGAVKEPTKHLLQMCEVEEDVYIPHYD